MYLWIAHNLQVPASRWSCKQAHYLYQMCPIVSAFQGLPSCLYFEFWNSYLSLSIKTWKEVSFPQYLITLCKTVELKWDLNFYDTRILWHGWLTAEGINLAFPKKPHSGGNCWHVLHSDLAGESAESLQAWPSEFTIWDPQSRRRESTPTTCPLTSAVTLWRDHANITQNKYMQ